MRTFAKKRKKNRISTKRKKIYGMNDFAVVSKNLDRGADMKIILLNYQYIIKYDEQHCEKF